MENSTDESSDSPAFVHKPQRKMNHFRYRQSIDFAEQFCHQTSIKTISIESRSRFSLLSIIQRRNNSLQLYLNKRQLNIERFHRRFGQTLKVDENLTLDSFDLVRTLGQGGYGTVFLAHHQPTNEYLALKAIDKSELVENNEERTIVLERQYVFALDHPNIVKFITSFKDNEYVYIGLEWLPGGDLYSLMFSIGKFTELQAKFYAAQMIMALDYLHGCKIVYRDLKPENVVLTRRGYIKLIDLGLAKVVRGFSKTFCGTPHYIAPEVIRHRPYTTSPDYWTLGIIIHEMVTGDAPYDRTHRLYSETIEKDDEDFAMISYSRSISTLDENQTSDWIRSSSRHYNMYRRIIHGCSILNLVDLTDECSHLIRHLLESNIDKRLGCGSRAALDLIEHRWFLSIDFYHLYQQNYFAPFLPIRNTLISSNDNDEHHLKITGRNLYEKEFVHF